MADNQSVLNRAKDDDILADDDPLAELARIAGIERPGKFGGVNPVVRHEPEFDLEDELLREFEIYDAPQREDADVQAKAIQQPSGRVEPVFEAFSEPEPELDEAELAPVSAPVEDSISPQIIHAPDVNAALEGELIAALDPFASYPDSRTESDEPEFEAVSDDDEGTLAESASVIPEDMTVEQAWDEIAEEGEAEPVDERPVELPAIAGATAAAEDHWEPESVFAETIANLHADPDDRQEDDFSGWEDLFIEEQAATAREDFEAETPPAELSADSVDDDTAEPIAGERDESVGLEAEEWLPEAAPVDHYGEEDKQDWIPEQGFSPDAADYSPNEFADDITDHDEYAHRETDEPLADEPAETLTEVGPVEPAPAEPVAAEQTDFSIDDLLAEVERFPIPATGPDWMRPETSRAAEKMRQEPVAEEEPTAWQADAEPVADIIGASPEPVVLPSDQTVETPDSEPLLAETLELSEDDNPFGDSDFEIDIGAIELDLAEDDKPVPVPVVETAAAGFPLQSHRLSGIEQTPALADIARLDVEDRWSSPASRDREPLQPVISDTSGLPFDPAQIGDTDEQLEQVADLDVPHLPVDHAEEPIRRQEFDIDIDSEMAKIYALPMASAPAAPPQIVDRQMSSNPSPGAYATTDNIDDFERALEEDYRRSMAPEIAGTGTPDRMALLPEADPLAAEQQPRSRMPLLAAGAVVAIMVLGGAGLYAYFVDDGTLISGNGEPRVILADKEPVKIKPEDTGGRTVPNQDKAVYDKVAGAATEDPKQENLVSSTEEPVDVVQKTLVPENMPMDPDGLETTPTEDTTDPRLLPETGQADEAAAANPVPGVQPRKVRTMIVKPDGTLVPREETALDPANVPVEAEKLASAPAPAEAAAVVPERLPGASGEQTAETTALEAAVEATPAEVAKTPESELSAGTVKAETVAEKPVEAVPETTKVAAVEPAADAAALEAAASTTVDETAPVRVVKTQKITTNAPVPESRPADQEVNVVNTVTDQGNVKEGNVPADAAPAETQQAALPAGTYVIQIASLPSQEEAQRSYDKLSSKYANLIGGRGVDIRKAEISGKGTFYRVRIPAGSKTEAINLCQRYKKAGGSCLVSK